MLTAAEQHQLRVEWNEPRPDVTAHQLMHRPIEIHAGERPGGHRL